MRLLLIDDHPLIHVALRALLADFEPPVELVGADSGSQAERLLADGPLPDLLMLDLELEAGGEDGFALLDRLRAAHPGLPIVCLSGGNQMADVIRAIDQGAMGFIPKHVAPDEFKQALLLVVSGGVYVPPMRMSDAQMPTPPVSPNAPVAQPQRLSLERLPLTPRQLDVLQGLLLGKPNKLIAAELSISGETVKDHVAAIFRALGVNSRTQAVLAVGQMARP